ncbi:hypothetical protein EYF80_021973 [Liparis tanakae]|uniref:Uncharacterized protein n=1 Tax=Liparis tanakae TaxID=230148 RepID=A0A4Z2HPQ0_9TELE|nr:hypothetical protein EYF80_021973 [Liparis tanakae]
MQPIRQWLSRVWHLAWPREDVRLVTKTSPHGGGGHGDDLIGGATGQLCELAGAVARLAGVGAIASESCDGVRLHPRNSLHGVTVTEYAVLHLRSDSAHTGAVSLQWMTSLV